MALVISALLTNDGREALAKSFGGPTGGFSHSYGKYFKIGSAGFNDISGVDEPLPPSAAYSDIQSVVSGAFYYKKTFVPADILFISSATMQFKCFLDLTDGNGNPLSEPDTGASVDGPKNSAYVSGSAPTFYELGIFDGQDKMIAYGTFPGETKLTTKTLNHLVNINF